MYGQERKNISEISFNERFQMFKEGVTELLTTNFNGEYHEIDQIVFLGVKDTAVNHILKNNPDAIEILDPSADEVKSTKTADPTKVHVIPIEVAKYMNASGMLANAIPGPFGQMAMNIGKKMARDQVDYVINNFKEIDP